MKPELITKYYWQVFLEGESGVQFILDAPITPKKGHFYKINTPEHRLGIRQVRHIEAGWVDGSIWWFQVLMSQKLEQV